MNNIHTLPSLLTAATEMDIMYRLEMALAGNTSNNVIVTGIKLSIAEEPVKVTIAMVKDMAIDNYWMIERIIGSNLTDKILEQ